MQLAQDTLMNMNSTNIFLGPKIGNDLLLLAAGEKTGGYTTANVIWDLLQALYFIPTYLSVEAYYNCLKVSLLAAIRIYQNILCLDYHTDKCSISTCFYADISISETNLGSL